MSFDFKALLGKALPVLAGCLTGPFGGLASEATKVLCETLGLEPTPENAQKAAEQIAAGQLTGEQLLKLKDAENQFKLQMEEAGFKHQEALAVTEASTYDSARKREVDAKDKWTPGVLAYIIVVAFVGVIVLIFSGHASVIKDPTCSAIVSSLITYVSLKADKVYTYYFGGMKEANEMLFNSTPIDNKNK